MKKAIAFLSAVILTVMMTASAFAAKLSPTVSATAVAAGDKVTVTLALDETLKNIASFEYYVYFDAELFTLTESTNGTASSEMTIGSKAQTDTNGTYYNVFAVDKQAVGLTVSQGTVYTLVFTAKSDLTAAQTASFRVVQEGVYDTSFQPISVPVENGTLSVTVNPNAAPAYTVSIPAAQSVTVGETVEIPVTVGYTTDAQQKYNAVDLQFSYDQTRLQLLSSELAGLTITANAGSVRVQGYGADKAFTEKAVTLRFRAIAPGDASVTLTSAKVDASAQAIVQNAPEAKRLNATTAVTVTGYTVSLPADFSGEGVAAPNVDYTFAARDKNYNYAFVGSTMGGAAVTVRDNGDGTFTVENVSGKLAIVAQKSGKTFAVTLGTDMTAEKSGANAAQYMTDYVATLEKADGFSYTVAVTRGGEAYSGYSVSEDVYTIPGADITGDIVFNVTKTPLPAASYSVSFTGSGAGDIAEKTETTVAKNADYTFTLDEKDGCTYTVTATMDGAETEVTQADGKYTVRNVTGDLIITIEKQSGLTVAVNSYVELDGKTMFLVTASDTLSEGMNLSYGGTPMFFSAAYDAYAYLVIADKAFTVADARAQITATQTECVTIAKDVLDVNMTGKADVNDAQLTYDIYNAAYADFSVVSMEKFLRADVNGSKRVDVEDASRIVAEILA